jgi:hypothetical protein
MVVRLDHLVVLVGDLEYAAAEYARRGFSVTPGGEHADGLTRNALVPFRDGTYLELVSFVDPEDTRDNVWGWRRFAGRGGGLIDYCAASDDLDADVARLRESGLALDGPEAGGRRLPDGAEIRWRSVRVRQEGRALPFLIEDLTDRALRVPGGAAAEHPNGAAGIARVEVVAPDTREVAGRALLDRCGVSLVTPEGAGRDAARRLGLLGPGPFAVGFRGGDEDGTGFRLVWRNEPGPRDAKVIRARGR